MSGRTPEEARRRLLIVDDSRLILRMVRDFFTPHGWEVVEAEEGRAALAALEAKPPDVVVADILMPGMDGWALLEEIRRRPQGGNLPFVFLTTEADLPQRLRGLNAGADDYVTKPFSVEELHARVERLLARRGPRPGAGTTLLSGSVRHLGLADLLQILSLNGKDGVVELEQDGKRGSLVIETGMIVHARCGSVTDVKAVHRLLSWTRADFRVLPLEETPERTMCEPATNVLMDGLVSLDEWNRWVDALPAPDDRLELAAEAGEGSPAEAEVVAKIGEGATLQEVLDGSAFPDGELAEAVCALLDRGAVRRRP
jgi:DNA-binding response OmpR family regulator